jgi:3-methyladenine DNA glycosylase AlkC
MPDYAHFLSYGDLRIPVAPSSIEKGSSLSDLLDVNAIECLAHNLTVAWPAFPAADFKEAARAGLGSLGLMDRGRWLARVMRGSLPPRFEDAVEVILGSLTPANARTEENGMGVFFYLPHTDFIAQFGHEAADNGGRDPFPLAMRAQYELTQRFTAEFSIRPFLQRSQDRTLAQLLVWTRDESDHVRRLCSEGTRPRLPWGMRLGAFIKDPTPTLPILEALKDDAALYVRRSVANHLGDLAKDHLPLVMETCERWLVGANAERQWLIRHAVRYPAKKGDPAAIALRKRAGGR